MTPSIINWNGSWPLPTQALFYEQTYSSSKPRDPDLCKFTLGPVDKEIDGVVYLSMKRLYLEEMDPTEYIFAEKMFGTYVIWEALLKTKWFNEYVEKWRKELTLKIKAQSIKQMLKLDPSFSVLKYLAEYSIVPKSKKTKKIVSTEELESDDTFLEDLNRLGLEIKNA